MASQMGEDVAERMEDHALRWHEQASLCHNAKKSNLSKHGALS